MRVSVRSTMRWLVSAAAVAALAGGGPGAPAALASPAGESPGSAIVASSLGHPGDAAESAPAAVPLCPTANALSDSAFEIDVNANLKVDGASPCIDWLADGTGSALRSGVLAKDDKPSGGTDDSFGQGAKEDDPNPTIVDGSIPPQKSDLKKFGVFTETTATAKFLELFWSRINSPQGTTNMDFELNQKFCDPTATPTNCANNGAGVTPETPVRTAGDKLITYDLSQGGTVPTISIRTWTGSAWGPATVISGAGGSAIGSVNTSTIAAADSGGLGALDPFTFGEAALNFSVLFPPGSQCGTFGSAYLKSRSSDAFNSEIKDFIAPERVLISNCAPTLVTHASGPVDFGASISDTATLSGATATAGGTITFRAYSDATCATLVFTSSPVTVNGNGNYGSGNFTPTAAGTYYWTASYTGDATNAPAATACGDANESSLVRAAPTLVTHASGPVTVGSAISDTATLSGATASPAAGGTITFRAYSDATCATLVFTSSPVTVNGNGNYGSGNFTPTAAGTYYWTASYTGDANNSPAATACGDANESSLVNKASPTIGTTPNPASGTVGVVLNDSAALASGFNPTGSIVFGLFGPDNATCAPAPAPAPVFTQTVTVSGNGAYNTTGGYTTTQDGTYHWTASYSGDNNNNAVASACADEAVTVGKATPTAATAQTLRPNDLATVTGVAGLPAPTGTVDFSLFATSDCSGAAVFQQLGVALSGGSASTTNTTFDVVAANAGTYKWTVHYSGDANYLAADKACGAEQFTASITNG